MDDQTEGSGGASPQRGLPDIGAVTAGNVSEFIVTLSALQAVAQLT